MLLFHAHLFANSETFGRLCLCGQGKKLPHFYLLRYPLMLIEGYIARYKETGRDDVGIKTTFSHVSANYFRGQR